MDAPQEELADLVELIMTLSRRISARASKGAGIDLGTVEALAMGLISATPGLTSGQIAAELNLKSSNASTTLRSLEQRGYLERRHDPADGRVIRVYPTAKARQNLALKREAWAATLLAAHPDHAQLTALLPTLKALDDALAVPCSPTTT